jgi:N-acetyl sugar amidotransferase
MDTTDSKISFNKQGICDYCVGYIKGIKKNSISISNSEKSLQKIVLKIKKFGKSKKYDCIIGLSGGADSSYLLYYVVTVLKLRPLAYSVDTGWNLNVAVENIEKLVKKLKVDLFTEVINWNEMKDLQRAFFYSNVPYQDLPQDHVIFAGLYNFAIKNKIKYVLTGANMNTEGIRPPIEWVYINDLVLLNDIHKKFGKIPLKTLPKAGMLNYKIFYEFILGMKRVYILDLIHYDKEKAEQILFENFGWQKYDNKHYENVFTRFYEGYYLLKKFGFDKRKCYLSNLILSGQITKEEASKKLKNNPYQESLMHKDLSYIAKKLDFSIDEFTKLIHSQGKSYKNYKNSFKTLNLFLQLAKFFKIEKREFR